MAILDRLPFQIMGWHGPNYDKFNATTVGTPGSAGERLLGTEPDIIVFPSYFWHRLGAAYIGLWRDTDRQADPDGFPRVGFLPLHKGQWRMTNALKVTLGDGAVGVRLPLSTRHATWHQDSASYTSPFSIGQQDPALPRTLGRRVWGLMLAPVPAMPVTAQPATTWRALAMAPPLRAKGDAVFWRARHWYGTIGLDRYKDYILDWPDSTGAADYPRVFNTRENLVRFKGMFDRLPKDQQTALNRMWGHTGDPEVAAEQIERIRRTLTDTRRFGFVFDSAWYGHHDMWGQSQFDADDVLAWPEMPAADRRELRALLALGAYALTEPDVVSAGIGDHTGNPNMSLSRQLSFANFAALLPDHPMHDAWARYMGEFTEYKLAENEAPGGGWFEFGGYHTHGFYGPLRGFPGQVALNSPNVDRIWQYIRDDMDYLVNLLTPVDPRYGARLVPGGANSPNMPYGHFGEWSAAAALRDAGFAANLRWAFDMSGRSFGSTDYGGPIVAWDRPWLAATEPALESAIYPGVGVVFRAHQGAAETYMYFRAGYCWSHWYVDQGHFVLYGKGHPLMPGQHYQYYSPRDKTHNMYNTIRFGHPANEFAYAWPDGNVLDHAFGPRVDYAWASMGYPEWYVSPGHAPGFGEPRPLADVPGQQQGAFHWNRQVAFLKGRAGKSPNYFVFRDTFPGDPATSPEPTGGLAAYLNLNFVGRQATVKQAGGHLAVDTDWPVKLDVVFAGDVPPAAELIEEGNAARTYGFYTDTPVVEPVISRYWVDPETNEPLNNLPSGVRLMEQRVLAVLQGEPGRDFLWMAYPRDEGEALPPALELAPGVIKVTTAESTDYVFLSTRGLEFEREDVVFAGGAGAVRVGSDGTVTLALTAGAGRIGYKGYLLEGTAPFERTVKVADLKAGVEKAAAPPPAYAPELEDHQEVAPGLRKTVVGDVTEYLVESDAPAIVADGNVRVEARRAAIHVSPAAIRFVAPERTFVQLTVGGQGVRGVGPFDLTFTADRITGTVDGDVRTLVATRPPQVVKPMYHMDGWRYYAGHADDSSCDDGRSTPQFNLAFGVTAGTHHVEVAEWRFPSLPPAVARKRIE